MIQQKWHDLESKGLCPCPILLPTKLLNLSEMIFLLVYKIAIEGNFIWQSYDFTDFANYKLIILQQLSKVCICILIPTTISSSNGKKMVSFF